MNPSFAMICSSLWFLKPKWEGKVMENKKDLRAKWACIVDEWMQSGKTIKSYCKDNNLSTQSFYRWKQSLSGRSSEVASRLALSEQASSLPSAGRSAAFLDITSQARAELASSAHVHAIRIHTPSGCIVEIPL
jgi:hypothetical protein